MGASSVCGRLPSDFSLRDELPKKLPEMLQLWTNHDNPTPLLGGPLARDASQFVVLRCALRDSWHFVSVNRSSKTGRRFGPLLQGFPVATSIDPTHYCRLLMQQPRVGDSTRVYFRAAAGQDIHMGYLFFTRNTLCERAFISGNASRWERLELQPTLHKETWCFHLWSHETKTPICWPRGSDQSSGVRKFVRRCPRSYSDIVVFTLEQCTILESLLCRNEIDTNSWKSCDGLENQLSLARQVVPRESLPQPRDPGIISRWTRNAIAYVTSVPQMVPNLLPGRSLLGTVSSALLAAPSPSRPSMLGQSNTTLQARDSLRAPMQLPPFELLSETVIDAETSEVLADDRVYRGSRRIESVKFLARQDLQDVKRVVKVSYAFLGPFLDEKPMGTFVARDEPYVFQFEEQSIPRSAPPGKWNIEVSYIATNVELPLFSKKDKFRMT